MPKRRTRCERKPGADRPLRIPNVVGELHFLTLVEDGLGILDHLRVQRVGYVIATLQRAEARRIARIGLDEQRVEIEVVKVQAAPADLGQHVRAPHHVLDGPNTQRSQDFPALPRR